MAVTRREFIKRFGAAAGGIGAAAVGYDHLIPYIYQPDEIAPGVSTWYATSCRECPAGCGMVVRSRESHIVKCEGNPQHPINRGTLCARGQAALQGLYDPDRIKGPLRKDSSGKFHSTSWDDAVKAVGSQLAASRGRIAFISDLQTGSLEALSRAWLSALGSDRYLVYEPINYEWVKAAYGGVVPSFDFTKADLIISYGADFLETWISPVEYARQFAEFRKIRNGKRGRLIYVGPRVSMTAANADARITVPPGAVAEAANILSHWGFGWDGLAEEHGADLAEVNHAAAIALDAKTPLALSGVPSPTGAFPSPAGAVNTGRPHAVTNIASATEVEALISAMENGAIDTLVVFGANPVYSLPASARFEKALERVKTVISLSSFMDETSAVADWILPSNTPLESWGDYQPYPDVTNLMQPTMGTLFDTRHTGDILIGLAQAAGINPQAAFRSTNFLDYLKSRWAAAGTQWENLLQVGGRWASSADAGEKVTPQTGYENLDAFYSIPVARPEAGSPLSIATPVPAAAPAATPPPSEKGQIDLWAYPSIYLYDGRGANRRWLQEMPEPMVKGCWGSWAELHPETAKSLGVANGDVIEIAQGGATITAPVYIWSGVAKGVVAVPMGQGHTQYGRFASSGANVLKLLNAQGQSVKVRATGARDLVTRWKGADTQAGRDIAKVTYLGEHEGHREVTLPLPSGYQFKDFQPGHKHVKNRWAMVVDTDRCIGCNACVTACYAENNVPVVGADGIRRNREMAWMRVDRYINWQRTSAPVLWQPMLCQHCDSAPCEPVCPVFAAYHTEDGINGQIYNRCVGTRYCANNCPYKVRRFNWFEPKWPEPLNYQLNPDVTVRSRGVMEKCTFCIQRVRQAGIAAKREGRPIRDGEVVPACAQTCPTGVYTFGDLLDPESRVSKLIREDPRAYQVLHELNTKTAVIYLRRIVEKA